MLKIQKCILKNCWLILMISSLTSLAQPLESPANPKKWTLAQCIEYAHENNITLNNMRLNAQSSQQSLLQSQNARYPNLNGSISQGGNHGNSTFSTNSNFGLNSSVTLYNGGYQKNDVKSKELALQAANLDIITSENDIILQITQAYLNILLSNESIRYAQDLIGTSEAQVKQG
jgi:outer membrane protein